MLTTVQKNNSIFAGSKLEKSQNNLDCFREPVAIDAKATLHKFADKFGKKINLKMRGMSHE